MGMETRDGLLKLSDGSVLKLKVFIVDVKETGFSPFGGVHFDVSVAGAATTQFVPEDVKKAVSSKPLAPPQLPTDGWEPVEIVEFEPAIAEMNFESSKGLFRIKVVAEPLMVARNTSYRTVYNEPIYSVSWVAKVSWRPVTR